MAGHPMYLQYVKPVVSGIDGVFSLLEGIDVLKDFVPELRELYQDCPIASLPSVTEEQLSEQLKPNSFEFVRKISKSLVFSSSKETITVYTLYELESYVAVIKSRRKVSVKVLGEYFGKKYPIGTHKLFSLLKKRQMISPSFEEYQPNGYDVLDFDELASKLDGFLEAGVSMEVNHRLPSQEEIEDKHCTCFVVYTVPPFYLEVINVSGECFLINVMADYHKRDTYDILVKEHGFEIYEHAFYASGVIEDLFYCD